MLLLANHFLPLVYALLQYDPIVLMTDDGVTKSLHFLSPDLSFPLKNNSVLLHSREQILESDQLGPFLFLSFHVKQPLLEDVFEFISLFRFEVFRVWFFNNR